MNWLNGIMEITKAKFNDQWNLYNLINREKIENKKCLPQKKVPQGLKGQIAEDPTFMSLETQKREEQGPKGA